MSIDHLPKTTQKLWLRLKDEPLLSGFSLVGGTAIALKIGHRISEDIDLAFLPRLTLPRAAIRHLLDVLAEEGFCVEQRRDMKAEMDFENSGMDIMDYHQDFTVSGTKLTFFTPDRELRTVLKDSIERDNKTSTGVHVPDMDALFVSKCLVTAHRNKSRDWVDLYSLMNNHRYTPQDMARAFNQYEPGAISVAIGRLTAGKPSLNDEGYHLLMDNPPSLGDIRDFFKKVRMEIEVKVIENSEARIHRVSHERNIESLSQAQSMPGEEDGYHVPIPFMPDSQDGPAMDDLGPDDR